MLIVDFVGMARGFRGPIYHHTRNCYLSSSNKFQGNGSGISETTVRTEMITELILESAGPVVFKTVLLELIAFRLIPVIFCKKSKARKKLKTIINSRQGLSHNKISNFSEMNSRKHFPRAVLILVPTVFRANFKTAISNPMEMNLQIAGFR